MAVILHVTIVPAGAGGVQPSPGGDYVSPGRVSFPQGTVVTLTAIPFVGYFDHWEGDASGTDNPTIITMDSDKEVTAVFEIPEEIPTHELTTDVVGNGTVAPSSGVFGVGDQIILVATPDEGNLFDYWSGDIDGTSPVPGMPNNLQVTMDRDRHIIAHFVEEAAPPPPPPPCSISITAPDSAQEGETVNVSAKITNNSPIPQIYYTEIWAGADFIDSFQEIIAAGSSKTYPGSFIMPAYDTAIGVWVEVYYNGAWEYNNAASKEVALVVGVKYEGTITRKELDYDAVRVHFPVE